MSDKFPNETGAELIAAERLRQITGEGYSDAHDDGHPDGALALAAIAYASPLPILVNRYEDGLYLTDPWPWYPSQDKRPHTAGWKPRDPRQYSCNQKIALLIKAGALIAAEIDRLRRARKRENRPVPEVRMGDDE